MVEIPALPGQKTGDKFLEGTSTGTILTPSKQAYGEWEWDYLQMVGSPYVRFISGNAAGGDSHFVQYYSTNYIQFMSRQAGYSKPPMIILSPALGIAQKLPD